MKVNIYEAKNKLPQLISAAIAGDEVIITKYDKAVIQLIPYKKNTVRQYGMFEGQVKISDDFDSPELKNEVTTMFYRSHTRGNDGYRAEED
ncbi:type II toxin-antitoxin system prevent-host-death family antitoxin [Vibrio sp. HA2012]|uniref:type II toxin-antitoxin system Phd/YefM family antitoxin n=1 Tax=Vibrio sp. HA2012 TaxID=1971595 RepID=UPI000C2CDE29|nr:type II toxin-antitoxin system Phd/YefM family antitoxin [Vibrio sp. HA2012]PJC87661.1 type II toxin-antitoxin system prevent-host-death family antitoxin [Vibrio sp. HA2012]